MEITTPPPLEVWNKQLEPLNPTAHEDHEQFNLLVVGGRPAKAAMIYSSLSLPLPRLPKLGDLIPVEISKNSPKM